MEDGSGSLERSMWLWLCGVLEEVDLHIAKNTHVVTKNFNGPSSPEEQRGGGGGGGERGGRGVKYSPE